MSSLPPATEAGDEHALERRDIQLRAESAFRSGSRDNSRAAGDASWRPRSATAAASASLPVVFAGARSIIDFLEELVVLPNLRIVGRELERPSRMPCGPCRVALRARRRSPDRCRPRRRSDRARPPFPSGRWPSRHKPRCATLIPNSTCALASLLASANDGEPDGQQTADGERGSMNLHGDGDATITIPHCAGARRCATAGTENSLSVFAARTMLRDLRNPERLSFIYWSI